MLSRLPPVMVTTGNGMIGLVMGNSCSSRPEKRVAIFRGSALKMISLSEFWLDR